VLCAAGSLAADVRKDLVYTVHAALTGTRTVEVVSQMHAALERLSREGQAWLAAQGLSFVGESIEWTADMRYVGQSFELTIALAKDDLDDSSGARIKKRFHDTYEQIYGYQDESAALEVLDVRVTAIGQSPKPPVAELGRPPEPRQPGARRREIFLDGRRWSAAVYERDQFYAGFEFSGPAIVEQYDTTVFVTPEFRVSVDGYGNLIGEHRNDA
jgi:N-methylhydantoinase A